MITKLLLDVARSNVLKKSLCLAAVGFMIGSVGSTFADVVTGITYIDVLPENVTASSNTSGYFERYLTRNPDTLDRLDEPSGGHGDNPNVGGMWLAETPAGGPQPWVTFDMLSEHNLSEIRIWNWNDAVAGGVILDRGIKDFEVVVAGADGVFGGPVLTDVLAIGPGVGGIDGTPGEGGVDFSQTFPLLQKNVQFVRINALSNWGSGFGTGLSEVRIREIPEPMTLSLGLLGLGSLAVCRWRRA